MEKGEEKTTQEGKVAAEIIQAVLKAKKNLRLYPVNNPMYQKIVEETFGRVDKFISSNGPLKLVITRNQILLGDEVVYTGDDKEENLALFFFRDGLRSITFESGLDAPELQDFLQVITSDFDGEGMEEDVVTMLWEKDFGHIKYQVDETVLVDEDESYQERAEDQAKKDASTENSIEQAYHDVFDEEPIQGIIPVPISEEDAKALSEEMLRDRDDKLPKLVDLLFDMLYVSETDEELKDVARILASAMEFAIRQQNINGAIDIARRVKQQVQETRNDAIRAHLKPVFSALGSPASIKLVGEMLDSTDGINEAVLKDYLGMLGPEAIPEFIKLLGVLNSISGRKAAVFALTTLGKNDIAKVAEGLKDPRWFVVRNIVLILRSIGDRKGLDLVVKVVEHEEPRVRKEVLKMLGELGGTTAARVTAQRLNDPDITVAAAAAGALGKMNTQDAKASLMEKIMSKEFQDLELSDMKHFFEALARFRDKETFQFCMGIIEKTPMFNRQKFSVMKAGAVYCLGLIGSPSALPVLEALQTSKEGVVAEYASMAVQRINNVRKKQ